MKKVGIREVAERAGVSVATVSYVTNNNGRVAEKTKNLVLKVAEELGFIRDDSAARLRTGQSRLIGVIINNIVNPFFSELVAGLELEAYRNGYLTILATAQNDMERQAKLIHSMVSQGVAAIILTPVHETSPDDLAAARSRKIPVVSCVRDIPGSDASFVGVDDDEAGFLAANTLLEAGHTEMVFIGGYNRTTTWCGRRDGIYRALTDKCLPTDSCRLSPGPLTSDFAAQSVLRLIESDALCSGIISFNDDMATGIYASARDSGLNVGEDVSVVSFDNLPVSKVLLPQLTTVDIFPNEIGKQTTRCAIEMIRSQVHTRNEHLVDPVLVQRASLIK